MNQFVAEMHRRRKIYVDNQSYFTKCALVIVGATAEAKAAVIEFLDANGYSDKYALLDDVLAEGVDVPSQPRIHIVPSESKLLCNFEEMGKPGYPIEGSHHTSPIPAMDLMPSDAAFVYRQMYVAEEDKALPMMRVLTDRTRDLTPYTLCDVLGNFHAFPELQRLLESETSEPA